MSIYTMGIDVGSTASKCVILKDGGEIVAKSLVAVGTGTSGPSRAIAQVLENAGMTREQMEPFMDGRLLSAVQARELGLIDGVCYYDEAIDTFYETFGWGDATLQDITPVWEDDFGGYDDADWLNWLKNLEEQAGNGDALRNARGAGGLRGR